MTKLGLWLSVATLAVSPAVAFAAPPPQLIHPAVFGTVHEVLGSQLLTVTAGGDCAQKDQLVGGYCFGKVLTALGDHGRVLTLARPAQTGDRVEGVYGRDFMLYDVAKGPDGYHARALTLPTSNVLVPRNCYALNGEDVAYDIGVNGPDVAQESQLVVCDGGPNNPHGPYQPEGAPIPPGGQDTWHRTEQAVMAGDTRYLAVPGTCDPQYSIKTTYCAQPAITYLQNHPDIQELDLVAALHAVQPGDVLGKSEIDQWVLKRKGTHGGFKADSRWFDKSAMPAIAGCTSVEDTSWRVDGQPDGLYIHEEALNRCGAPPAPVPTDVVEAYGDEEYVVVNCSHGGHAQGSDCMNQAADIVRQSGQKQLTIVAVDGWARPGDHLYSGSQNNYDIVGVKIAQDNSYKVEGGYSTGGVSLQNCTATSSSDPQASGFILLGGHGYLHARQYQWMECPVY